MKKFLNKRIAIALLFCMAVTAAFTAPSTLAYIITKSNSIVNTFSAPYFPPEECSVEVGVVKTVENIGKKTIGPEGFRFKLVNNQDRTSLFMTTDADGKASVTLPFTDADLGKTYTYTLTEVDEGMEYVGYSDAVYTISITINVNADNQLVADILMNDRPVETIAAEFVNVYAAVLPLPVTGDDSNMALYLGLMLVSFAGAAYLMRKSRRTAQ